jgi:hypothetical protein
VCRHNVDLRRSGWNAVAVTAVHQLDVNQPVIAALNEPLLVINVAFPMTLVALFWSIPNNKLHRHRALMIVGVLVAAMGLAASVLTAYTRIAPI